MAFTHQRADWYTGEHREKSYAFHERIFFPHSGAVVVAAISGTEAQVRTSYWLELL
jgi:hypothetical protein